MGNPVIRILQSIELNLAAIQLSDDELQILISAARELEGVRVVFDERGRRWDIYEKPKTILLPE